MRRIRHGMLLTAAIGAVLSACQTEGEYQRDFEALGGPLRVLIVPGQGPSAAAADAAVDDYRFITRVAHPWKAGPLGRTNQILALEAEFSANPSLLPLIHAAKRLARETGGLYNPALGELNRLWGFHQEAPPAAPPTDIRAIADLLAARPSMDDVVVDGIRMRSTNPAVRLDFGAMVLGHALDVAAESLRRAGAASASIVNRYGAVTFGTARLFTLPCSKGHRLRIESGEAVFALTACDGAFVHQGRRYHRHLDPRTGQPTHGLSAVAIVADRAADAAAYASALFAAGPRNWRALTQQLDIRAVLVVPDEGPLETAGTMRQRLLTDPAKGDNNQKQG